MKTLDRKLVRDLWQMRSQAFTIALVVAAGIGAFVAQLSTYDWLLRSRDSYYEQGRFAHVFAPVKRAPAALAQRLEELPGVAEAVATVVFDVTLDLPDVGEPVVGRMIGLDGAGQPRLNRLFLRQGRFIEAGRENEVLVSEAFATARRIAPGDRVAAILNGRREILRVVGVVLSPEYIFSVRAGSIQDDRGFGVFWMDRERLATAFDMEGAFNFALLRLSPAASEAQTIDALGRLLAPYGALGAYGRADQLSHKILTSEIEQQRTMATIFPTIFLGVAVFLLNVVLARLVATQREQIAMLKAVGYADRTIALHYLKLVMAIVLVGEAAGVAIGVQLGEWMTGLYTGFFHFPAHDYRLPLWIPLSAVAVSAVAALAAALGTVRGIMRMAPAEAMRPLAPARYRRMLLERLGLEGVLSAQARMLVRTVERRPVRTLVTTFGIACSITIIVAGTFWRDALEYFVAVQFYAAQRDDASVVFVDPVHGRALREIAHLPGVTHAEAYRSAAVRLRAGQHTYRTGILGLPQGAKLRQLLDEERRPLALPPDGLLLSEALAQRLGLKPGDTVEVEFLEGKRLRRQVAVAGLVHDLVGLSAYMDMAALNRLMQEGDSITSVAVRLDGTRAEAFYRGLKEMPKVATVSIKASALDNFNRTAARNILFYTAVVTVFAAAIAVGVVYNSARIALAERAWELASLRVLGFTRQEVSRLLLGELAIEIALAIPLGLTLGYWLSWLLVNLHDRETMAIPLVILPRTYAYATLAILAAGLVSALIVRLRVDRLDLVAVLKTRE